MQEFFVALEQHPRPAVACAMFLLLLAWTLRGKVPW